MPAQAHCTGPAHFFVGFSPSAGGGLAAIIGAGATGGLLGGSQVAKFGYAPIRPPTTGSPQRIARYLGTTEVTPQLVLEPSFEPLHNDLTGKKPYDMSFQGEDAWTFGDFTRWDEDTLTLLQQRPTSLRGFKARGTTSPGDMGSLILTEGLAITLWVVFPYGGAGGKPAYVGDPAGMRFPNSMAFGPDKKERLGTQPEVIHLAFYSITGNSILYDHDISGLPPPT